MNDIAQFQLATVPQVDWDNYGKQSVAPPDAMDASGKPIVYFGVVESAQEEPPENADGFLNYVFTITLVGNSAGNGYQLKYVRASAKPYSYQAADGTRQPKKGNPNRLSDLLRSAGLSAKPINADQFRASVNQVVNLKKQIAFTIDWYGKDKQTGEVIKGFNAFPVGLDGKHKWVVKAGDVVNVLDAKGQLTGATSTVKAETIFANAELRFFRDPKAGK